MGSDVIQGATFVAVLAMTAFLWRVFDKRFDSLTNEVNGRFDRFAADVNGRFDKVDAKFDKVPVVRLLAIKLRHCWLPSNLALPKGRLASRCPPDGSGRAALRDPNQPSQQGNGGHGESHHQAPPQTVDTDRRPERIRQQPL